MYDALLKREVMVISKVMLILSDNARASEILNHLGSRAKMFCRMCMVCHMIVIEINYDIYLLIDPLYID